MSTSTVAHLMRTSQAFCNLICEKQTLDYGIAYSCSRFAALEGFNQFREMLVEDSTHWPEALRQAKEWFASHALTCRLWAPAASASPPELDAHLTADGLTKRVYSALMLTRWEALESDPEIKILPARAMRGALRSTFMDHCPPNQIEERELLADAADECMDDPSFDMFVALRGREPVGRYAFFQVGDIARLMDFHVHDATRNASVGATLLAHAVTLAKRLSFRNVCAGVESADTTWRGWFESAGFAEDGQYVEFHLAPTDDERT